MGESCPTLVTGSRILISALQLICCSSGGNSAKQSGSQFFLSLKWEEKILPVLTGVAESRGPRPCAHRPSLGGFPRAKKGRQAVGDRPGGS